MKKLTVLPALILGLSILGFVGCSKDGSVDTAKVQSAFQSASTVDRAEVDKAVTAIKAGDYAGALASLQKAAASVQLTPEQKSSLQELISQVQAKITELAKKAVGDSTKARQTGAEKTATDLQKTLGK